MEQPLTDHSIYINPSLELREFIKSLQTCDDMPLSIRKIKSESKPIASKVTKQINDSTPNLSNIPENVIFDLKKKYKNDTKKLPAVPYVRIESMPDSQSKTDDILIKIADLFWLREQLRAQNNNKSHEQTVKKYLHTLLADSKIYLPKNQVITRNEELDLRCKKLKAQQTDLAYKLMTKNVDNTRIRLPDDTIAFQLKEINRQLIGVAQFIVSVLAGFAFGFIGVELMVGRMEMGFRILLGVACAMIIAIAEIYFLIKKLNDDVKIKTS